MLIKTFVKNGKTYTTIDQLTEWDRNPRGITNEGFERLKKQITKLGQHTPLLVDEKGVVYSGNMRLKAYNALGIKDIWINLIEGNEVRKLEYALSANDRAGYYEDSSLSEIVYEFKDEITLDEYNVDLGKSISLNELLDTVMDTDKTIEDVVPEINRTKTISKYGEMYQLDKHRLLCGDSLKKEDIKKLLNGQQSFGVLTDPPYNVGFKYENFNDEKSEEEYKQFYP